MASKRFTAGVRPAVLATSSPGLAEALRSAVVGSTPSPSRLIGRTLGETGEERK